VWQVKRSTPPDFSFWENQEIRVDNDFGVSLYFTSKLKETGGLFPAQLPYWQAMKARLLADLRPVHALSEFRGLE
jgi:hypothetical protein